MTYQDPDPLRDRERETGSNAMWGWIAGAVVLVLMLVFLFGGTTDNTNTASNQTAPVVNTPPANNMANSPRGTVSPPTSSATTGQSSATSQSPSPAPSGSSSQPQ